MIILLAMAILFPLCYTPWLDNYYYLPKFILLLGLASIATIDILLRRRNIQWYRLKVLPGKWWLVGFILFSAVSTILSPYRGQAYNGEFARETGFLTYVFTTILFTYGYLIFTEEKLKIILKASTATASLIAVYGIFQYYGFWPHFYQEQQLFYGYRSSSTIGNPNFFGTYAYMMFVIACYQYFKDKKWLSLLTVCLIYASVLTSLTRSVWLSSFTIFIVIAIFNWRKKAFMILSISLVIVTSLLYLTSSHLNSRILSTSKVISQLPSDNSAELGYLGSSRGIIWNRALDTFTHSSLRELLIGTGPDTFDQRVYFSPHTKEKYFHKKVFTIDKAHNIFLETLLTLGIPAFICLYIFYIRLLTFNKNNRVPFYLSLMLIGYLIQGFFNIDVISVYPLFMVLLGGLAVMQGDGSRASFW